MICCGYCSQLFCNKNERKKLKRKREIKMAYFLAQHIIKMIYWWWFKNYWQEMPSMNKYQTGTFASAQQQQQKLEKWKQMIDFQLDGEADTQVPNLRKLANINNNLLQEGKCNLFAFDCLGNLRCRRFISSWPDRLVRIEQR